ncbi:MAG: CHAT domain-containing protein [Candidatus Promineifilaceae bacterium]
MAGELINYVIAKQLSTDEMQDIATTLDIYLPEGSPSSKARELVAGAQRHLRFDTLFILVKRRRPQLNLIPHLYELVAATFTAEEMQRLCNILGLDTQGISLDREGLIGWGFDQFLQRQKAELAQDNSDTAAFLAAIKQVKSNLDLSAFDNTPLDDIPPNGDPPDGETTEISYENFDLTIDKANNGYAIRAVYGHGGEAVAPSADLNLIKDANVKALLVNLDTLSGDLDQAEKVGALMRERLFPPDIWTLLTNAKNDANYKYNSGLRLRLRIEPPEIGMLPWEYCFDKAYEFLALNRELPIIRYIEQSFIPDDVLAPRPTRVLLASASPSDYDPVDAAGEAKHIRTELQPLVDQGELEIEHLNPATLDEFQTKLVSFRPHILHFIGHGVFDLDTGQGALIFENQDGKSRRVSPRQLGTLLRGSEVKVILLNACKTAAFDQSNAFMGLAPALVRAQIPAVIAMQFAMPDDLAARFAHQMYHYLAMGLPLDRAITEARINLYTAGEENIFWAIPVLFMRAQDGVIWKRRPTP